MPNDKHCVVCGKKMDYPATYHAKYCSLQCWKDKVSKDGRDCFSSKPPKYLLSRGTRRCHDCGKPTSDYRCQPCWDKLRKKKDSNSATFPAEAYSSWQ